jgi:ribosome-associated protein
MLRFLMIVFELKTDFIELTKLLKITGVCATGGEAKVAVTSELVKVDGKIEIRKANKIRPGQIVEFNGSQIQVQKSDSTPRNLSC